MSALVPRIHVISRPYEHAHFIQYPQLCVEIRSTCMTVIESWVGLEGVSAGVALFTAAPTILDRVLAEVMDPRVCPAAASALSVCESLPVVLSG